jgi:hypothetical protein
VLGPFWDQTICASVNVLPRQNCRLTPPTKENALPQFSGGQVVADSNPVSPTLSARRNRASLLCAYVPRGRRVHGRWQCPRCSTCLARGEGPSVVRRVNLEDATWQEVVGVVVGQDVLRGNLRRCIGDISDSERYAASMTRRCHSGKSPTEPASSTRSVRTRSWVSVRVPGFALGRAW